MQREVIESSPEVLDSPRAREALSPAAVHFADLVDRLGLEVAGVAEALGAVAAFDHAAMAAANLTCDILRHVMREATGLDMNMSDDSEPRH